MKPTQLKDIPDLPADSIIHALHAKVKKCFPPKEGENNGKPWKIQNATIEQDGATIDVFIADNDTTIERSWVGRHISIEAHKGEKGWSGVYAFDDTFRGPAKRKVKVTKSGSIALLESNGATAPAERPARQEQRPAQQRSTEHVTPAVAQADAQSEAGERSAQRQQRPQEPAKSDTAKIHDTKGAGLKVANLQLMCMAIVETYVAPRHREKYNVDLDASHKHAWAMNICIQLERAGRHNDMPSIELAIPKKPEPKPDAAKTAPGATRIPGEDERDGEGNFPF